MSSELHALNIHKTSGFALNDEECLVCRAMNGTDVAQALVQFEAEPLAAYSLSSQALLPLGLDHSRAQLLLPDAQAPPVFA